MSDRDATGRYSGTLMAFPYFGGKAQYAQKILEYLPAHETYVEPFAGAATVLLNKPRSSIEVLNDKNEHVVTFFRVLRQQPDELRRFLDATPYSRAVCERWEQQFYGDAELPALDDLALAGRWFALRHMRFAGRMSRRGGFSAPGKRNEARAYRKNVDALEAVRDRLTRVTLECDDYAAILERYDGEDTLFYLDPPYVGNETDYGVGGFDHARLADALADLTGRWVLSYRELPAALDADRYHVETFAATDRAQREGDRSSTERLVMNFDPDAVPGLDRTRQTGLGELTDSPAATDGGGEA